jgi:diguanylate cyclase (GGDEF)-like protein/PAS domain S-box-containing protein
MPEDARILLVNDQADARALIRRTLERVGLHHVTDVADGRAAIHHLRTQTVHLLITDVHMPHLDGWRLARMVRSGVFKCSSSIPIVVVSATFSDRIAEVTAKEFGVSRFLALKDRKHLVTTVYECLGAHTVRPARRTLLVVEDDPDSAQLAERVLRSRFDVEIARDGQAGLDAWKARHHDLVLLDVMLPKLSGADVLRGILGVRPTQAVVAVTADATMERSEELMLEGAADFIAKPFQPDQLRRVCEAAARREDYMVSNEQFAQRLQALRDSEAAYRKIAQRHQRLLDNLGTVVFELDGQGELCFLSRAWHRLMGFPIEDSLGRPLCTFLHPEDQKLCQSDVDRLLDGDSGHCELEARAIDKHGEVLWAEIAMDVTRYADDVKSVFGRLVDVTERKRAQQQLEYLAMHDGLTGLFNRHYFESALSHLAATSARGAGSHALLYIDLDHFKVVNDSLGHHEGDIVLKQMAGLLKSRIRQTDTLCRLGGDEFALLLANVSREHALGVANELRDSIGTFRYTRNGQQFGVSCSIGIGIIDEDLPNPDEYFMRADIALYVAKKRGRNLVHLYDAADWEGKELWNNLDWARRLRDAIAEDRLELYLQPILHLPDDQIRHFEALLRLHLPDREQVVAPGVFIPALEQVGQMGMVDHWVITRAVTMLAERSGIQRLAINLSGHAFRDEKLVPLVRDTIQKMGVDPGRIIFEITETASVANLAEAQRMIDQLRELGCRFALDDFGTGFSTFTYLKHFPADYLKLDGSFIKNVHDDKVDYALVKSIHEIAHALGKETIAEGVEDGQTLAALRELGIDHAQGYFIGLPSPIEDLGL